MAPTAFQARKPQYVMNRDVITLVSSARKYWSHEHVRSSELYIRLTGITDSQYREAINMFIRVNLNTEPVKGIAL